MPQVKIKHLTNQKYLVRNLFTRIGYIYSIFIRGI
jgi:hypothetical protein